MVFFSTPENCGKGAAEAGVLSSFCDLSILAVRGIGVLNARHHRKSPHTHRVMHRDIGLTL